jgi:hypothetical protein
MGAGAGPVDVGTCGISEQAFVHPLENKAHASFGFSGSASSVKTGPL